MNDRSPLPSDYLLAVMPANVTRRWRNLDGVLMFVVDRDAYAEEGFSAPDPEIALLDKATSGAFSAFCSPLAPGVFLMAESLIYARAWGLSLGFVESDSWSKENAALWVD